MSDMVTVPPVGTARTQLGPARLERQTVGTGCCFYQQQGTPRLVAAARKVLADTTKQSKRSVKAAEVASDRLNTSNTPETATQTVTDVESLGAKNAKSPSRRIRKKLTI
jgi:hypothetical protein